MTNSKSTWILLRALILIAVIFFLLPDTRRVGDRSEKESQKSDRIRGGPFSSAAETTPIRNPAELKFSYRNRHFRGSASKNTMLVSQRAVITVAGELKKRIALPFEIEVVFDECGGPDSFYDANTHKIIMCYELIDVYSDLFSPTHKTRAARDDAAKGATVLMFLHEVAHAVIQGWDLPITGREEDAADQFSTLLLINGIPNGDQMALDGARSFKLLADLEKGLKKDYSDPHSMDEQRFFNTNCLVYGHRPRQYEYLIRNGALPVERAFDCEEEYARVNKSWQRLLGPHLVSNHRR